MTTSTVPKTHYLDQRHRTELIKKRGLNQQWCEVNYRSVTAQQASELLPTSCIAFTPYNLPTVQGYMHRR
jgi:hypothetical protein